MCEYFLNMIFSGAEWMWTGIQRHFWKPAPLDVVLKDLTVDGPNVQDLGKEGIGAPLS